MSQPHPLFYDRAEGVYLWDVDGNRYLDYTLSQGPMILGHSHPHVLERVSEYSKKGQLFAGQHMMELELAEKLQQIIPCAELMRFASPDRKRITPHCAWLGRKPDGTNSSDSKAIITAGSTTCSGNWRCQHRSTRTPRKTEHQPMDPGFA